MVRKRAGLLTVLLFMAGLSVAAQDEKKDTKKDAKEPDFPTVVGFFESYKNEILTLKVDKKEGDKVVKEDQKFKVPGDTVVGYSTGKKEDKVTTQKAKEHLKDVKKGSLVAVTLDADGKKVLGVGVVVSELPAIKPKDEDKDK